MRRWDIRINNTRPPSRREDCAEKSFSDNHISSESVERVKTDKRPWPYSICERKQPIKRLDMPRELDPRK